MNVNYFIRLSFNKLETFDVNRTSLSTFVLVRNSLISALTEQKYKNYYHDEMDDIILEEDDDDYYYDDEDDDMLKQEDEEQVEKGKVWLDSCFDQLEQEEEQQTEIKEDEEDSDEDEVMPLSPQQNDNDDFYSKPAIIYNQALMGYDIPFLTLD